MTRPVVPALAEELYEELGTAQPADEQLGWPFLIMLAGAAAAMGELPPIVRDTDEQPGWVALFDPDQAPALALPWLAQFAGVRLTTGLLEAEQRQEIANPPAFNRGTPGAMKAAGAKHLTGTKTVILLERDTSPYHITVVTRTSETPDAAVTLADLLSQKPAGLILEHVVAAGTTWDEAVSTWDSVSPTLTWEETLTDPT